MLKCRLIYVVGLTLWLWHLLELLAVAREISSRSTGYSGEPNSTLLYDEAIGALVS